MTSRDFCYWLQGYLEVSGAKEMNEAQVDNVRKHLAMVFVHEIDLSMGDKAHQDKLNKVHSGSPNPWPQPSPKMRC